MTDDDVVARELAVPALSLVVLIGVTGSGKSGFAARHFGRYEVISSDACRGLVADDETDQSATAAAFEVLHFIASKRLEAGRLTVVDATNVQREARKQLVDLARAHDVLPVTIVLDVPEPVCAERNAGRPDRDFGPAVVRRQHDQLRRSMRGLAKEGFRTVHVLRGVGEVDAARVTRERLFNDYRHETGPFDVLGDVHGCRAELETLLEQLGYTIDRDGAGHAVDAAHPDGRTAIFVGDLIDRGPDSPGVLRLVMGMVAAGHALAVPGNHEDKLVRALRGRKVTTSHGLAETLGQLAAEGEAFRDEVERFCDGLVSHLVLDGGDLVVAHAGLKEAYHGRASGRVRSFALYGDTTGETDQFGLPVRYPWADDYRGRAVVAYGHTPTPEPEWVNNTICLDTGCVFGGRLTALRYPEKEIVSVPARRVWYEPARPFPPAAAEPVAGEEHREDGQVRRREPDVLDLTDVLGKRGVETAHHGRVSIREESAAGALEVMSRFALHPRWLLYLPPTMAPCATSERTDLLEHPAEAFDAYRRDGVRHVICQEKHMGSRAVVLVCRDGRTARHHFGAPDGTTGAVHTRTGRSFFEHERTEQILGRLRSALEDAGVWAELGAEWLLFDCELLPWSAKAGELVRSQYATVGAAARSALPAARDALERAAERGLDVDGLLARTRARDSNADAFVRAYRRYCWPTDGLAGVRLAPFQLLATDTATFEDRDHGWHLGVADRLLAADPELVQPTRRMLADTGDADSVAAATRWWEELTGDGGEGMVVKPDANLTRGNRGLVQPGLKVRGREYLRLVYGPDYTEPAHLERLRKRRLNHKRSLALREYALGLEALTRAVHREPLWRVHEAVFAVLALESEAVDPRL
ncbi:polynucleotide kinase-phosphatase [Haloechinothrix sp. YIM 98757]|uniref:Polynucleotide kinase-phosphatase n=1 Tax=Haloechinothrix aidingensis TaxID=2752311 RepID=A0A838AD51_9PSEU|nr:polynucleotide kinase-phosphatase [Haloechinothrix aidingensis]MBA0127137.1 polynucleotide kinase-phosphatase [Haloechinothrix aidingensis]